MTNRFQITRILLVILACAVMASTACSAQERQDVPAPGSPAAAAAGSSSPQREESADTSQPGGQGDIATGFFRVSNSKLYDGSGQEFKMYGINTTDMWSGRFIERQHSKPFYQSFADYGMNTARICTNYQKYEIINADGSISYKSEAFKTLERSIQNAAETGIYCIIDLHCPPGGYLAYSEGVALFSDPALQERFVNLWREIAGYFADNPNVVGYGLCNEPLVPWKGSEEATVAHYGGVLQRVIDAIREVDKNHIIIVQASNSYYDEGAAGAVVDPSGITYKILEFPDLKDEARNILLEFHLYNQTNSPYGTQDFIVTTPYQAMAEQYEKNISQRDGNIWLDKWKKSGGSGSSYGKWSTVSADISLQKQGVDIMLLKPYITFENLSPGTSCYIDDISITRETAQGEYVVWKTGYNEPYLVEYGKDSNAYTPVSLTALMENPWQKGDYLLGYENVKDGAGGEMGAAITTWMQLTLRRGETLMLTARVRMEGPESETATAWFKTAGAYYTLEDPQAPVFQYNDFNFLRERIEYMQKAAEKYDCPVYIGELGSKYIALTEQYNYEQWFADISGLINECGIHFTWHSAVGSGFGLFEAWQSGSDQKPNPQLDAMFRKYFTPS